MGPQALQWRSSTDGRGPLDLVVRVGSHCTFEMQIPLPWEEGGPAAGAVTSRSGPGEGSMRREMAVPHLCISIHKLADALRDRRCLILHACQIRGSPSRWMTTKGTWAPMGSASQRRFPISLHARSTFVSRKALPFLESRAEMDWTDLIAALRRGSLGWTLIRSISKPSGSDSALFRAWNCAALIWPPSH